MATKKKVAKKKYEVYAPYYHQGHKDELEYKFQMECLEKGIIVYDQYGTPTNPPPNPPK